MVSPEDLKTVACAFRVFTFIDEGFFVIVRLYFRHCKVQINKDYRFTHYTPFPLTPQPPPPKNTCKTKTQKKKKKK